MSLYDVIHDISEQQVTKTETGDTRIYGVVVGIVAKNYSEDMKGRLCVTIPTRDKGKNELKWARLAMPSGGKSWGTYFMPEIGDQVLLAFEGGNIERPYVIGCIAMDNYTFLTRNADEHNQSKCITTKHGSNITFWDDTDDKDGAKDKITIQSADKRHTILLDNENEKILIQDKKKKNYIELNTKEGNGSLEIKVDSSVTIKVGDKIKLSLNGESGVVKLEAQQVKVETNQQFSVEASGSISLEGGNVNVEGRTNTKITSGGVMKVSGSPVNIGM